MGTDKILTNVLENNFGEKFSLIFMIEIKVLPFLLKLKTMKPTRSFVACPNDYLLASNEICREHGLYLSRNPVKYALRFDNYI